MSIAEKLSTVAENVPKVYKAGQSSMIDESKIIEKTVSGAFISVDDVSEIPHSVGCKVSGVDDLTSVKVTRCGKNLIDETQIKSILVNSGGTKRNGWELSGLDGTFTLSVGSTWSSTIPLAYKVVSVDGVFGNYTSLSGTDRKRTININKGEKLLIYLYVGETVPNDTILLEYGTSTTDYEPYNGQTFTPNADGTVEGMTSLSPYMNVFTDNADVNISMTYRKSWGMQTEYDRFWDSFQNTSIYPNRCGPAHFAGTGWNNDTFKPKYDIKVSNGYFLFYNCGVKGDLVEILNGLGVTLDTSEATSIRCLFWISRFTRVGEINLTGLARVLENTSQAFSTSTLITIDKMIVNENNVFATNMFTGATKLANIIIEGTMADNISFPDSPLSKDSILSVFNALSETITGKTLTLKLSAVNTAFETSKGAADGSTSEEWNILIATKSNWTISLV